MRWVVLILVGIFLFSFAGAINSDNCDSDMVAYWQFENDNLEDSYGNHDGGAWTGPSDYNPLPAVGYAADFKGGSVIEIPDDDPNLRFGSSFTVEMWVKSAGSDSAVLFEKGDYKIEWILVAPPNVGQLKVGVDDIVIGSGNVDATVAHHVALTWSSSGEVLKFYVDGAMVGDEAMSDSASGLGLLRIGDGFIGLIDEVAYYGRDLSIDEIGEHIVLSEAGNDYCSLAGVGGESSTKADFSIDGCTFVDGDDEVGVATGECSRGAHDGEFFCGEDGKFKWYTDRVGLGCAMGKVDYKPGVDPFCCPAGMGCVSAEGSDFFRCERRTVNCFDMKNLGDCRANHCVWFDGQCLDGTRDYGCWYYEQSSNPDIACGNDEYGFGAGGIGAEMCGESIECGGEWYGISEEDCKCVWDGDKPVGEKCRVRLTATQMFSATGATPNEFSCSSSYDVGECDDDGKQTVSWLSELLDPDNIISDLLPEDKKRCLEDLGCVGDSQVRSCGEPPIKLPGFSLFAFFVSSFLIGVYYFVRGDVDG